jgi:predicted small integral membrane protein
VLGDGDAARPQPSPDPTDVARSVDEADTFDMASATKAEIERALPSWHAKRSQLDRDRIRQRDTTEGDRLAVGFLRAAGASIAFGMAVLAAWFAYSAAGLVVGVAAGAVGLAVAMAAASGVIILIRGLLDRKEHTRQEAVARLGLGIRRLDKRIHQAYLNHGIILQPWTRPSF